MMAPSRKLLQQGQYTFNGGLPAGWRSVPLAELGTEFFSGGTPSTERADLWDGDIAWTTSARIDDIYLSEGARNITSRGLRDSSTKLVPKRNVLIGTRVGVGKTAINTIDIAISQDLTAMIVDRQKVLPEFLVYAMRSGTVQRVLRLYRRGTTIRGIVRKDLLRVSIPLPPLGEQREIARVLSTIRRAIEATDRVIAATRELKKSLMRYLFTYGPVPVDEADRVPLKETEFGPVPEAWEVVRLAQVTEKPQYGYTQGAARDPVGPKFLRITDIGEAGVDWTTVPYCKCDDLAFRKYRLARDDIVFARTGATTGKSYIVKSCPEAVFASYLIRVRAKGKGRVIADYLYGFFNSALYWYQIRASKAGSAQVGVNASRLMDLAIPLPSLGEQQRIATALLSADARTLTEGARKAALEALFKSVLRELMTGRVGV